MRRTLLGVVASWVFAQAAFADERILSFDSQITVQDDGTLKVRETIRVRAEGNQIRRGIYRDFPTRYPGDKGQTIVVGFAFDSATRDGNPEPWRIDSSSMSNGVRIYLGSAKFLLTQGEHVYELNYRTDRQMGFFADHDEIYWNATGNGWIFPIDHATAEVILPTNIPRAQVQLHGYTGAQGSKGKAYEAHLENGVPVFSTTHGLDDHEGLTIVVGWPKGYIAPGERNPAPLVGATESPGYDYSKDAGSAGASPFANLSPAERMLKRRLPRNNAPLWIALIGFLVLLAYYWFIWDRVGRDPPGRVIIPEYEPPADQSPASMRYIMRMGYDNNCFGAAVLALAVKGYLRIQQDAGILGFGKTFTLIREDQGSKKPLSSDEHILLKQIFADGPVLVLKQENYRIVGAARRMHYTCLKNLYSSGFFRINGGWHALGIVMSILLFALAIVLPGNRDPWPTWYFLTPPGWATIALALGAIIFNGVFGLLLKAPTPKGQAAMDHIRGFKMYMEVAEGEELKRVSAPPPPMTPALYEAYLPAALALGVEQKWAERFAAVLDLQAPNYQPTWYVGPGFSTHNIGAFSSGLGSSLSSAISSSSTAPGSKSGGGGGGSSGGGGGGGGGGGW